MNRGNGSVKSIAERLRQLNQMVLAKSSSQMKDSMINKESLFDVFLTLFKECSNPKLKNSIHIQDFINKFKTSLDMLKELRVSIDDFSVKDVIGRGHFGEVKVVTEKKTGDVYALKILEKNKTLSRKNVAFYEEERDIMVKANSPWLTKLQYAFQDDLNLYLVMEFHPGGDLLSLLSRYDDVFEESMALFYLSEMVLGINALHRMGYIHRDIKPENILIDRIGHIKLADFGSACHINNANSCSCSIPVGTPDYLSPEILMVMQNDESATGFDQATDWWSLGVCAYEMLFGKTPFADDEGRCLITYSNIMNFEESVTYPQNTSVSESAVDFLMKIFVDKETRMSYEDIVKHSFFSDTDFDNISHETPPFVPTLSGNDDTSNFDEYEVLHTPMDTTEKSEQILSGTDLPFIGFTYAKDLCRSDRPSIGLEFLSSTACNTLENQLKEKSTVIQNLKDKISHLQSENSVLQSDQTSYIEDAYEKSCQLKKVEAERDILEQDRASHIVEIKSLKRMLKIERQEKSWMETKTIQSVTEIQQMSEENQKIIDFNNQKLLEYAEKIKNLETDKRYLYKKLSKIKTELDKQIKSSIEYKEKYENIKDKVSVNLAMNLEFEIDKSPVKPKQSERLELEVEESDSDNTASSEDSVKQDLEARLKSCLEEKSACELRFSSLKVDLQKQLRRCLDEKSACEAELNTLREDLSACEAELHTLREEKSTSDVELNTLREDLREQIARGSSAETEINSLKRNLETLRSKHEFELDLEKQLKTALSEKSSANADLILLRRDYEDLKKKSEKAEETFEFRLRFALEKKTTFKTELESLKEEFEGLKQTKEATQKDLEIQETKRLKEHASLESRLEQVTTNHEISKRKLDATEKEKTGLETQLNKLQRNFTDFKSKQESTEEILKGRLKDALHQESCSRSEFNTLKTEFNQLKNDNEVAQKSIAQLKSLCTEIENQADVYQSLNKSYEEKHEKSTSEIETFKKTLKEKEQLLSESNQNLSQEKKSRIQFEEKSSELSKQLQSLRLKNQEEINSLNITLLKKEEFIVTLNDQLTSLEKKDAELSANKKILERKHQCVLDEFNKLKEELSRNITKTNEFKASNFKLSKTLEKETNRSESILTRKLDVEHLLEAQQLSHEQELYKLEATISQQSKLIEYLQNKVENPPKRKKKLFGTFASDNAPPSAQLSEMQSSLEHEREKCSTMHNKIIRLQDELYKVKRETIQPVRSLRPDMSKSSNSVRSADSTAIAPSGALDTLVMSPSQQPAQFSQKPAEMHRPHGGTLQQKPSESRMHHNIPHRFITGLNSRATTCAVCLGSIHFVKQASRCQECNIVCHPKCVHSAISTCGLPSTYASQYSMKLRQATEHVENALSKDQTAEAAKYAEDQAWIKMPRPGKKVWDRRYVVLQDSCLYIYDTEDHKHAKPLDEFALCPKDGVVSIQSAVTSAELINTASSDLPYIIRMDFQLKTTCWPGRTLYLMFLNFGDKQKWVATLEALIHLNQKNKSDHKILSSLILSVEQSKRMSLNCTLPINQNAVFLGADEGLFTMEFKNTPNARPVSQISGVDSVHLMDLITDSGCNVLVAITGKDRNLVLIDFASMQQLRDGAQTTSYVDPLLVEGATACTTFVLGKAQGKTYICVSTAEKILVLKYSSGLSTFSLMKEVITSQPCSSMYFGRKHILFGSDKFYKIDIFSFETTEFLDPGDRSLAFAAHGTSQFDSFPVSIQCVSLEDEPEEYLLCFHEFGVFVNSHGKRSRDEDMKWCGLPLSFAYYQPYLYIVHFNALQVVEITPTQCSATKGRRVQKSVNGARYLGAALSSGAVYIGAIGDHSTTQVVCYKGNFSTNLDPDTESNTDNEQTQLKTPSSNKENHLHQNEKRARKIYESSGESTYYTDCVDSDSQLTFVTPLKAPLKTHNSNQRSHKKDTAL